MTEQGSKIVKDFAPLLESSNPALVNGAKKALTELDPEYLAEYPKESGETIAQELQKATKTNILQKIVQFVTGIDYAQKNIDKAFTVLKANSDRFTNWQKTHLVIKEKSKGKPNKKCKT
ncbi:MAG: hypothetical protein O7C59_08925 [Rickettsia endosymbiont of Ixodes persulcatus]|nr:hypothetical protein [Rickettsia endosymbiont of Ixodes persulcatus]MCZ6903256.1 hypothetical protein [Rickettsia endosymbiont of Ixodes persulcatus]MCZ6908395.1 hypothetical protein [Rickettsia endosymbiont of Ixodes persulcatus]MCZ6910855.1 hypothetical protein [Rickettsia endosymbiont of Ixodes persulcatus]MCZ6914553.1 hypothetical protein [Rickettsia endosymbiont of Ixodes persulcatus]